MVLTASSFENPKDKRQSYPDDFKSTDFISSWFIPDRPPARQGESPGD